MEIRLIAMDMDGTALLPDRNHFSPRLLDALDRAYDRGVLIVPVTGRQFGLLPAELKQPHKWDAYAILCNGGQIRRFPSGEMLHGLEIDPQGLKQLLELSEEYGLPIEFSRDSTLYLTRESYEKQLPWPNLIFHRDKILAKYGRIVPSLASLTGPGIEKVNLPLIPSELREPVSEGLAGIAVSAVWASASSMEITHPDATKGKGLQQLCGMLGIPMTAVMALGDSGNDISMLQQAGLGVAMGNAPEYVKAAADCCADRYDEDGVAKAIEQYVLSSESLSG